MIETDITATEIKTVENILVARMVIKLVIDRVLNSYLLFVNPLFEFLSCVIFF